MNNHYIFSRPLYVMLKPAGAQCNMRCSYCYYTEKSKLYANGRSQMMSDEILEKFIRQYMEAQTTPEVLFTWHGGEALMRPISFYEKALKLQHAYAAGRTVRNSIQTNGTLIDDRWCEFLRNNEFLVGISIDGTEEMHDRYRRMAGTGGASFSKVMRGIERLKQHGVEWNVLAVVNDFNAERPEEFYRFFKEIECKYLQFTPIVERVINRNDGLQLASGRQTGGNLTPFSVTPRQWGQFLCSVFDEWVRTDVGKVFVQIFDATLANWMGMAPGICTLSRQCGHAAVMEHNGDLYSCDHFVYPEHLLGNIADKTITEMMYSDQQRQFARIKTHGLPRQCRECRFVFACNGECPKNRFATDCYGNIGLNYLCEGYYMFFSHVAPFMDFMKAEIMAGRPPSNVMYSDYVLRKAHNH